MGLPSAAVAMIATNAIFMGLAIISVVVRIYVRLRHNPPLFIDDYLIFAALICSVALAATNIIGVPVGGFGYSFSSLPESTQIHFFKSLFALQFFYVFAVAFVKLSVLYFYARIFSVGRFPTIVRIMFLVVIAWLIAFFFATLLQIYPIWCNWIVCNPTTNYPLMYVCQSATDIVLDIIILCLPAYSISQLQMSLNKKIGLGAVFGLGVFCVVSSAARLAYTAEYLALNPFKNQSPELNNDETGIIMWSGIEACASTICANLPSYGPLITKSRDLEYIVSAIRSKLSPHSHPHHNTHKGSRGTQLSSSSEHIIVDSALRTTIEGGVRDGDGREGGVEMEMGRIEVSTTVHI
ncbi:hypothetical protein G7Y79_00067g095480 [Physcia stellaris]|nr:hypothetical protein G7Y79_00067g095480 [Physcia stellaris]